MTRTKGAKGRKVSKTTARIANGPPGRFMLHSSGRDLGIRAKAESETRPTRNPVRYIPRLIHGLLQNRRTARSTATIAVNTSIFGTVISFTPTIMLLLPSRLDQLQRPSRVDGHTARPFSVMTIGGQSLPACLLVGGIIGQLKK